MKAGKQQSSQQSNRFKGTNHTLLKAPTILNNVKMGKKTTEQKELIDNLNKITFLDENLLIFLKIFIKWPLMQATKQYKMKLKDQDLKY